MFAEILYDNFDNTHNLKCSVTCVIPFVIMFSTFSNFKRHSLKAGYSPFCASVLLITKVDYWISKLCKFRMFCIFLNINTSSYLFKSIANQNSVKFSDSS